jgi:hypothetical protein
MKIIVFLSCLCMLLTGGLINAAVAKNPDPAKQCVRGAAKDYQDCIRECKSDFQEAKEVCRGADHACALACAESLDRCEEAPLSTLESCKNTCNSQLDAAKATCRDLYGKGTEELDTCIDQAQVNAFLCRDECRETVSAIFQQCRTDFRNCISACKPQQ